MRFAVLGVSSPIARLVSRSLSEHPSVESVVQADEGGISRALADCDVALGCFDSDIDGDKRAAEAAIEQGIPYVSSSDSADGFQALSELDEAAAAAGAMVVAGMSWTPGLTNLMAKLASARLDETKKVTVALAASSAGPAGASALAATIDRFSNEAVVFDEGNWRLEPAGTKKEQVFFPLPVGWCSVRLAAAAEPLSLPQALAGVEQIWTKAGIVERRIDRMVAGMGAGGPGKARRLAAETVLSKAMSAMGSLSTRGHSWSAARVDVSGTKNNAPATITYGVLDQLHNLLAIPLLTAGLLIGGGGIKAAGVVAPESVFDPPEFFSLLADRGVRLAQLSV